MSADRLQPKPEPGKPDDIFKSEKTSRVPPKGDLSRMVMAGSLTKMPINDDVLDDEIGKIKTEPAHPVEAHVFDDVCSTSLELSKRSKF